MPSPFLSQYSIVFANEGKALRSSIQLTTPLRSLVGALEHSTSSWHYNACPPPSTHQVNNPYKWICERIGRCESLEAKQSTLKSGKCTSGTTWCRGAIKSNIHQVPRYHGYAHKAVAERCIREPQTSIWNGISYKEQILLYCDAYSSSGCRVLSSKGET